MKEPTNSSKKPQRINYKFWYWGPFLYHTQVTSQECKLILKEGKKYRKKSNDYRYELAGHLTEEYKIRDEKKILQWLSKYFESYVVGYRKWRYAKTTDTPPALRLASLWINYMKAGDFNPPHHHSGDLSFVLFPAVPKQLIQEKKKYIGTSGGPGAISWEYGEGKDSHYITSVDHFPTTGDLFIFPAALKHWVYPFKSKGERVSLSGNLTYETLGKDNFRAFY